MSKPIKKRLVLSVQYFEGGMSPTNLIRSHEVEPGISLRSAFKHAANLLLEELPQEKETQKHHE